MTQDTLQEHLSTGLTAVCQCWRVIRKDGVTLGFTDHDLNLSFGDMVFVANSGLSARALASSTGLSVNNTEAVGALSSLAMTSEDIAAGLYDEAQVEVWRVNWRDTAQRKLIFRGSFGEITRSGGAFQVDLRGLTQNLNRVQGRSYLRGCSARLGDSGCQVNLSNPVFSVEITLPEAQVGHEILLPKVAYEDGWFSSGLFKVLDGEQKGAICAIQSDRMRDDARVIRLYEPLRQPLKSGDRVQLQAGCDKRAQTCADKFKNILNYQGFPHLPGDNWITSVPRDNEENSGKSLFL